MIAEETRYRISCDHGGCDKRQPHAFASPEEATNLWEYVGGYSMAGGINFCHNHVPAWAVQSG